MSQAPGYYGVTRQGVVVELQEKLVFMFAKGECLEKGCHLHRLKDSGFRERVWENPELANHKVSLSTKLHDGRYDREPC